MPETLLTDEERSERENLPYPSILTYLFFFTHAGWDKEQVDRQPEAYKNDLISAHVAKGKAEDAMRQRIKDGAENETSGENEFTKTMPLSKVRDLFNAAGANYDPALVPDEAIAELIGRT